MSHLARRALAELVGTGGLVAAVVGSGVMATGLTRDGGLELLINAVATVATLTVLIWTLGPVSGAHFNPVVSLVAALRREMPPAEASLYAVAQVVGAMAGVGLANVMYQLPPWHASSQGRSGTGVWLGEVVATAGLLFVIGSLSRSGRSHLGGVLVPVWIGAAYFFTASTSFANPAVTLARAASDTYAGIAPGSVPGFVLAQLLGAGAGAFLAAAVFPAARTEASPTRTQPSDPRDPILERP